jgi:hypothetical protein
MKHILYQFSDSTMVLDSDNMIGVVYSRFDQQFTVSIRFKYHTLELKQGDEFKLFKIDDIGYVLHDSNKGFIFCYYSTDNENLWTSFTLDKNDIGKYHMIEIYNNPDPNKGTKTIHFMDSERHMISTIRGLQTPLTHIQGSVWNNNTWVPISVEN